MTITIEKLRRACAELRDELTETHLNGTGPALGKPALILPMALDVIASTPTLLTLLAQKLSQP